MFELPDAAPVVPGDPFDYMSTLVVGGESTIFAERKGCAARTELRAPSGNLWCEFFAERTP
jgi:hypothetical protein